jgi:hypothetical protein
MSESDIRGRSRKIRDIAALIRATFASSKTPVAGTRARTYSSVREHHMTNILTFLSTRTLLQIVFVLGSAVALKAWSLGLLFG